jgi:hypothetical protein
MSANKLPTSNGQGGWVGISSMLEQISLGGTDDSDSDSEIMFSPESAFPRAFNGTHDKGFDTRAVVAESVSTQRDSASAVALAGIIRRADSVSARNSDMRRQLQALELLSKQAGFMNSTHPRAVAADNATATERGMPSAETEQNAPPAGTVPDQGWRTPTLRDSP